MNVKGLKITDIIDMDWEQLRGLSGKELKQLTSRLVSASNKRIKRLESTTRGTLSFAYQSVEERGRKFSVRNKNRNQLEQEFKLTSNFLKMKTSTVKGWTKYRTELEKRISDETYGESQTWSNRTWKKFWKVYRNTEEKHGGTYEKGDSARVQKRLYSIFIQNDKRHNVDYFSDLIDEKYDELYKSNNSKEDTKNSIDSNFKTEDELE